MTPRPRAFNFPINYILAYGLSCCGFCLGFLVLIGWFTHSTALIQIHTSLVPMQFNTALGFLLTGLALIVLTHGLHFKHAQTNEKQSNPHRRVYPTIGILLSLVGGLTLMEYLTNTDLGIDQLLMQHYITTLTSHPGRMAPNTALCFLLSGILLCFESSSIRSDRFQYRYKFIGATVLVLGAVAFIGYLAGIQSTYGWGHLTRMALHTSAGFMMLGTAIIIIGYIKIGKNAVERRSSLAILISIGMVGVVYFFAASSVQLQHQMQEKALFGKIENVAIEIKHNLQELDKAMHRQLQRWKISQNQFLIRQDMQNYMQDFTYVNMLSLTRRDADNSVVIHAESRPGEQNTCSRADTTPGSVHSDSGMTIQLLGHIIVIEHSLNGSYETQFVLTSCIDSAAALIQWTQEPPVSDYGYHFENSSTYSAHQSSLSGMQVPIRISDFAFHLVADPINSASQSNQPLNNLTLAFILLGVVLSIVFSAGMWIWQQHYVQKLTLNSIQDTMSSGLIGVDYEGSIRFANTEAAKLFGYDKKELIGQCVDVLVPEQMPNHRAVRTAFQVPEQSSRRMGKRIVHGKRKNRTLIPIQIHLNPTQTSYGPLILATINDISDRIRLEKSLTDQKDTLEKMLLAIDEGVLRLNLNGVTSFVNPVASRLLGYEQNELIGKTMHDRVYHCYPDGESMDWEKSPIYKSINSGMTKKESDEKFWRKDGTSILVEYSCAPIQNGNDVTGAIVVFRDISERRKLDRLMIEHSQKLDQVNHDLEEFSYIASHDLQEPLRSITSFCGFLAEDLVQDDRKRIQEDLNFITHAAVNMKTLIEDLLAYSRAGRSELVTTPVSLDECMHDVTEHLARLISNSGATVTFGELGTVVGDKVFLTSVFQNLVQNAIKFQSKTAPLVIVRQIAKTQETITVAVQDNGIGIEPQYFEQIFGAFKRLHNRDTYPGSGIGLSIVKKIVERHGGRVWIESTVDQGSTFYLMLPITVPLNTEFGTASA